MQFAKVNGINLHFQVIGAEPGKPTIVFANSLGSDFRIWRDVIVRLVGDAALLTYDKRGHGLSDLGETPYSMDDHVSDLEALLDYLEVKNAVICGLSVGGLIAQGLYQRRKDLVRALILCDTAAKIGDAEQWNERINAIEAGGIKALSDPILERWFTEAFRRAEPSTIAGYRNMLIRTPKDGYIGTCMAIRDCDYREAARQIAVPTLCVVGREDGSTPPEVVAETAKLIPGARYQEIARCAHIPCVEQAQTLHDIIRAFMDDAKLWTPKI